MLHKTRFQQGIAASVFFVMIVFGIMQKSHGQTNSTEPLLFLSWNTETYVPAGYPGRALPAANSIIHLSLDVIDGGKRINLSPYVIRWYVRETQVKSGEGLDRMTVRVPNVLGEGTYKIRAQVNGYKNQTLIKIANVPVVTPKTVIAGPFIRGFVSDPSFNLEGIPYFFNAKQLSGLIFEWIVNGKAHEAYEDPDPNFLSVNASEHAAFGEAFPVKLLVQNPLYEFERAISEVILTYTP